MLADEIVLVNQPAFALQQDGERLKNLRGKSDGLPSM
jgi:hypothetical protein